MTRQLGFEFDIRVLRSGVYGCKLKFDFSKGSDNKMIKIIETSFRFREIIEFEARTIKSQPIDSVLVKYLICSGVAVKMSIDIAH